MDSNDEYSYKEASKVDHNVYLSSYLTAIDMNAVQNLKIGRILTIDLVPLADNGRHKDITYMFIKAADNPKEDLISHFNECYQFICDGLSNGHKVLVHCVAGVSRSATIVISYLMIKNNISFDKAMALVIKKRSIVEPNYGFLRQLKLFEKMGLKLDPMNGEYRHFLIEHLKYQMIKTQPWFRSIGHNISDDLNLCQSLDNYLRKTQNLMITCNSSQRISKAFKCRKCREYLFSDINVIKKLSNDSDKHNVLSDFECQSLYVEPIDWMTQYLSNSMSGSIYCHKCHSKLGDFHWNSFDIKCCDKHNDNSIRNCLIVRIDVKRVDSPTNHLL